MKATIGELKYDTVKTKLIKIFSDTSDVPTSELTNLNIVLKILSIKIKNSLENPHVAQTIITILSSIETETKSYKKKIPYQTPRYLQRTLTQPQSNNRNWRIAKQEITRRPQSKQGKNLLGRYGNPTKCTICHSINHWTQNCPDKENENTL